MSMPTTKLSSHYPIPSLKEQRSESASNSGIRCIECGDLEIDDEDWLACDNCGMWCHFLCTDICLDLTIDDMKVLPWFCPGCQN